MRGARVALVVTALALVGTIACSASGSRARGARDEGLITAEDLANTHETIEMVIQRKVPGVVVTRGAGGAIALQVRGSASWEGIPKPPLFILNGAPFQPGPDGALTGIDPLDIQSIRVLRAADAALYGIEGANGVIVITTKQPGKKPEDAGKKPEGAGTKPGQPASSGTPIGGA